MTGWSSVLARARAQGPRNLLAITEAHSCSCEQESADLSGQCPISEQLRLRAGSSPSSLHSCRRVRCVHENRLSVRVPHRLAGPSWPVSCRNQPLAGARGSTRFMGQRRGHQSVKDVTERTDSHGFVRKDFTASRPCSLVSTVRHRLRQKG